MNKDVKKYLKENKIRIPLSCEMAKYYLSIGENCIVKYRGHFFIISLANRNYSIDHFTICKKYDIKYLINNLYYLHDTIFLGSGSLVNLLVSMDCVLYD